MSNQMTHKRPSYESTTAFRCPECQEYGLVYCAHDAEDVWECLYCNHRINLTKGTHQEGRLDLWEAVKEVFFAIILILLILLLSRNSGLKLPSSPKPNLSTPSGYLQL